MQAAGADTCSEHHRPPEHSKARETAMHVIGELHCLSCGRYLADVAEASPDVYRLLPVAGAPRAKVRLREGRPFCSLCGGRAFVEHDLHRRTPLTSSSPTRRFPSAA